MYERQFTCGQAAKCEVDNELWWNYLPQREVRSEAEHEPFADVKHVM